MNVLLLIGWVMFGAYTSYIGISALTKEYFILAFIVLFISQVSPVQL